MRTAAALLGGLASVISVSAAALDFANPDWKWRLPEPLAGAISFRMLDTDRDGALMPAEAGRHPTVARHFARGDLDGDGSLSPLEFNNLALELAGQPSASGSARRSRDTLTTASPPSRGKLNAWGASRSGG
jgi:hypothetical protein